MLIPYRVKNPWKRFPYTTISLIALNVIVYVLTSEGLLSIRDDIVEGYAYRLGYSPVFNIIWCMFLHGDLLHLAGNMLFLWVFSPPVEDRLGVPRFLLVYLVTGIVGSQLQGMVDLMVSGNTVPGIGASGAIMGIMGAYWFIFSWSTVCVFYWFFIFIRGVWEVKAFWIIGIFILLDLVQGMFSDGTGGVANFAHVGGGVAGALSCLALRVRRDSEEVSNAKATQSEMKDLTLVPLAELEVMRKAEPQNLDIIKAMIPQAVRLGRQDIVEEAFKGAGPGLVEQDSALVMQYLLNLHGNPTIYRPAYLMRLGRIAEDGDDPRRAIQIYQLVLEHYPKVPENETALYRLGLCYWEKYHDATQAWPYLVQLLDQYPYGSMERYAKALLQKMQ